MQFRTVGDRRLPTGSTASVPAVSTISRSQGSPRSVCAWPSAYGRWPTTRSAYAPPPRSVSGRPMNRHARLLSRPVMRSSGIPFRRGIPQPTPLGPGRGRRRWPTAFLPRTDGTGATPGGGGIAAHIPTVAVPYEACRIRGSLVSNSHADSRLICMTGSRGRPGLLSARRGERSEPERALNRDGGRIDGSLGRKGPYGSLVATVLPSVLNGYTSIEARMTSTGEGKNT